MPEQGIRPRAVLDTSFCFSLYYLSRVTPVCFGSGGPALGVTWSGHVPIPSVTNVTQVGVTGGSTSSLLLRLLLYNQLKNNIHTNSVG